MNIIEARKLCVGDTVIHKYLKTEWVVIEAHSTKSNDATFRHKLQLKDSVRKHTFTQKHLELWNVK